MKWQIKYETPQYAIYTSEGRLFGFEKPARVFSEDDRVLFWKLDRNVAISVMEGLDKFDAGKVWKRFRRVGIKVNLCGGIVGCPSTFSDPLVVEGIVEHIKSHGVEAFVCEGNMRGFMVDESLIRRRGELKEALDRTGTKFVNLSANPIPISCFGLEGRLPLPGELLDPETGIVSMAAPKDHWECGLSMAQKNMYGAISERRKAIYHRGWSRIDRAVAAAVRVLKPDISVVGGRYAGAGWGPHFCVPVEWDRIAISCDALRVDKFMSEVYAYPYDKVRYAVINARGEEIGYRLMEGGAELDIGAVNLIRKYRMTPFRRLLWKSVLFPQYFIPHRIQHEISPKLENMAARFHNRFVDPLGKKC